MEEAAQCLNAQDARTSAPSTELPPLLTPLAALAPDGPHTQGHWPSLGRGRHSRVHAPLPTASKRAARLISVFFCAYLSMGRDGRQRTTIRLGSAWFNVKTGKTYYDVITATDWKKLSFDDRDLYRIILNDTENKKVVYSSTKYADLTRMEEEPTTESSAQRQRLPDLSRLSLKPAPAPTDACWFGGSTEVQLRNGFASKIWRLKHCLLIFLPCEGKDECKAGTVK